MQKLTMQTKKISVPVITAAMQVAGIVAAISGKQSNGSYLCHVDLTKIKKNEAINPRKIAKLHVGEIMKDFSWSCWDSPKIVLQWVAGELVLYHINGQHSIKAALDTMRGGSTIATCQVFFYLNDKECAKIFYQPAIRTKRIESWDAYRSALLAGDTFFTQIRNAIVAQELTTPIDAEVKSKADIGALRPIKEVADLDEDGWRKLDRLLRCLVVFKEQTDGPMPKAAKDIEFVRGLHDFADYSEEVLKWSPSKLREQLDGVWAHDVLNKAAEFALKEGKRRGRGHFCAAFKKLLRK